MEGFENNDFEENKYGNNANNAENANEGCGSAGYNGNGNNSGYANNGYGSNTGFSNNGQPHADRSCDIPGFDGNGSQPSGAQGGKPKKHLAAKILIPLAVVAVLGTSTWFTVHQVRKIRDHFTSNTVKETVTSDNQDSAVNRTEQMPDKNEGNKQTTTLIKNDSGIGSTDVSAKTTCLDVSEVVENVMPSVVAITDNLEYTTSGNFNPYNFYFGGGSSSQRTEETTASGSGVIIGENDEELLIVTNNHVVDNSGRYTSYTIASKGLTVQFSDGTTADAVIKGTDSEADLAVVVVKLSDISEETKDTIKIAVIGDSDSIKVGSGVIAIGNALGYGQSVTTGIVSAKDREVTIDNITRVLLQTDAAINPGNSGGGLFNANGELIGINSAKTSDTSVEGMGFAIPITSAEEIIEDLMNQVTIAEEDQGYLGITGESVTSTYVTSYGYPEGVSITRISEGSPAEKSGLQIYDIITAVDGKKVTSMNGLKKEVNRHPAGETVSLTISRPEGRSFKEIVIDVTLARYSEISDGLVPQEPDAELLPGEKQPLEPETVPDQDDSQEDGQQETAPNMDDFDSLFDWFFNRFN